MQVGGRAEPAHGHVVAALVGAVAHMQRLMEIAHDVDDEAQRRRTVLQAGVWIAHGGREALQRRYGISL